MSDWQLLNRGNVPRRSDHTFTFSDGERCVMIELGNVGDRWRATGIDLRSYGPLPEDPRSGLTVGGIRDWQLGELIRKAGAELGANLTRVMDATHGGEPYLDDLGRHKISIDGAAAKRGLERLHPSAPRPGRPRTPAAIKERVARIYREANVPGGHPTKAVADQLPTSRSNASKLVRRCRDEGYDLGPPV